MSETIEVFISYSKQDKALRDGLLSHLRPLEGAGIITWYDRQILPGTQWDAEIKARLNAADIILLLISADFLATDYCTQVEIPEALRRHKAGEATVMPVILRSCTWDLTPLAGIQAYPEKATPIVSWTHIDDAYTDVVRNVNLAATKIKERRSRQQAEQERTQQEQQQVEEQERLQQTEQFRQQQALEEAILKQRESEHQQQEQPKQEAARKQQPVPQQNQSSDATKGNYVQDESNLERESKYTRLEYLLKAKEWKIADQETYKLMVQSVNSEPGIQMREGRFTAKEILKFPCSDLFTIDRLWAQNSQGKFGFSVQSQIYADCGAPINDPYNKAWSKYFSISKTPGNPGKEIWDKFETTLGWRGKKRILWGLLDSEMSLFWNELNFSLDAPTGHLPHYWKDYRYFANEPLLYTLIYVRLQYCGVERCSHDDSELSELKLFADAFTVFGEF